MITVAYVGGVERMPGRSRGVIRDWIERQADVISHIRTLDEPGGAVAVAHIAERIGLPVEVFWTTNTRLRAWTKYRGERPQVHDALPYEAAVEAMLTRRESEELVLIAGPPDAPHSLWSSSTNVDDWYEVGVARKLGRRVVVVGREG